MSLERPMSSEQLSTSLLIFILNHDFMFIKKNTFKEKMLFYVVSYLVHPKRYGNKRAVNWVEKCS